ncbi:hypothetical protein HCN44_005858 [Aphidius gifuensis]|uniref:Phosphatidylinositol N-acetylglucosaminyltransferase subunit Q n=1 Tax=Aphidius gifuensis TaxID=684658 RepID=A0A835CRA0_APHGI|nr:hypothetical protein HCN44_005858 [Aphidius gifuensis]
MKSLLVFIPDNLTIEKTGYIYGKVIYDNKRDCKKFYIIGTTNEKKITSNIIGYYSNDKIELCCPKKINDWIQISNNNTSNNYFINNIIINNEKLSLKFDDNVIIIYNKIELINAEFLDKNLRGSDFLELKEILEKNIKNDKLIKKSLINNVNEKLLIYSVLLFLYPILFLSKITNKLLPVLKYSTLGMHVNGWLDNAKWMLSTILQEKKFNLKIKNHIIATLVDVSLGILALRLLLHSIGGTPPSKILLDNTESLVVWLMGAPAGLKLNLSFNKMLGKFFLYHIHLWWTFLEFIQPVMDFTFDVLLLFGRLGITFQISIAADFFAIVSFHTYCIYVYSARLFNIQIRGLTALFRLFLGKKKNPLRERVDSCSYQADQLFVGTLMFTILLFLMPTTWVYYAVFTTLRLSLIGFGGFLTRLRFYLQVIPVYTFLCWIFKSRSTNSSVQLSTKWRVNGEPITLIMKTVASPWSETWKRCIPDTLNYHPAIEWGMILNNIFWGQLLYPL